ncbi:hypothetical protein ACOMHN_058569 [Nucella lapillus]
MPKRCEEFFFFDHGTELCEHCRDICDAASVKGTTDQCWHNCRPYALILWPPKLTPDNDKNGKRADTGDTTSTSPSFPLGAQIGIPVLSVMLLGGVGLAVFILRRRKNQNAVKNRRPPNHGESALELEQTAVVLLEDVGENVSSGTSTRATVGTGTLGGSDVGIQEEGGGREAGRGSRAERRETIMVQPTPSHHADVVPVNPSAPVQVSREGNSASFVLALPGSPARRAHTPDFPLQRQDWQCDTDADSNFDLDSTELKTILPSFSDDSLLSEAGVGDLGAASSPVC